MGLYRMLCGENDIADILLKILDIDQTPEDKMPKKDNGKPWFPPNDWVQYLGVEECSRIVDDCIENAIWVSGRYRDIELNSNGTHIILTIRIGGSTRIAYAHTWQILRAHPQYISDKDDNFDKTYATVVFSVPETYQELCHALKSGKDPEGIGVRFMTAIDKLRAEDTQPMAAIDKLQAKDIPILS